VSAQQTHSETTSLGLVYGSVGHGTGAGTNIEDGTGAGTSVEDGTGAGTKLEDASTEDVNVVG
jgi:hypothetical protein